MIPFIWFALLLPLIVSCAGSQNNSDLIRLRTLKDNAYAGDAQSQYLLGIHYSTSNGWAWDRSRGHGWFLEAADLGYADAQYMIGMNHLLGQAVKQNSPAAITWLTLAAEQGHSRSQYQLGKLYLNGTGTEKDSKWGRYWLEQSSWAGHSQAQFLLAALCNKGLGGAINKPEAWAWLTRAGKNGNKEAKAALNNLDSTLTQAEKKQGQKLYKLVEEKGQDRLYLKPKIRYLQSMLNAMGFSSGEEDGINGFETRKAIKLYMQKKELPRDTSIDQLIGYLRGSI